MSTRRPIERIVAKHKKTGDYVDIGAIWPCRFDGEDFPRNVSFSDNRVSMDEVIRIVTSGEYYLDVRQNQISRADAEFED